MKRRAFILALVIMIFALSLIAAYNFISPSYLHAKENSKGMTNYNLFFQKPEKEPKSTEIKVYKKQRVLELYGDDKLIGRFKIVLGNAPEGDKNREGDKKTPVGTYYICTRNDKSKFTLFLGLSYPNTEDAERGIKNNLIDKAVYEDIKKAEKLRQRPAWNTALGGAVGIHGGGTSSDWTAGCIAVSDDDIKIIWEYTKLKTPVYIYE